MRPLENNDYEKGYKECLSNLTDVNGLTLEIFHGTYGFQLPAEY